MNKMKKGKKSLLISSLLIATLGMGGIYYQQIDNNRQILNETGKKEVRAYNYNSTNILDNVFEQDGLTILPFIYQNSNETVSKDKIIRDFQQAGLTITNISTDEIVTGTTITTNQKKYTVIIYGDVDGDGCVDVFDAEAIILHYVFGGENELKGIHKLVANVDNDDNEIDVFDAERIIQFFVGNENKLVTQEPLSDKEKDKEKPVISLKGDNPQYITLGSPYVELGATVTDNMDKNVKIEIDSSKVNTYTVGTYTVTYNAKDASGNKAKEVKRTVIVQDYVKEIEIIKPSKLTYELGEELDLTGGKIKVVYASGKIDVVDMNLSTISGFKKDQIGKQTITVTYKEKKATFIVEVLPQADDFVVGITITKPTKTTYKYGKEIDLSGASYKKIMNSGIEVSEEPITLDMLDKTTFDTLGNVIITVSYKTTDTSDDTEQTFTGTFEVNVENYVKEIKITTKPNKIVYKYEQTIDKSGIVVKVVMADNSETDITSEIALDITKATFETNKVTVIYNTNKTEDDTYKDFKTSYDITVENYVTGIEIVSNPTKNTYVEGEAISTEGMEIKAIQADGSKVELNLSDITLDPSNAEFGKNVITVNYETNKTEDDSNKSFTETFEISVIKKIQNIIVTEKTITGYRYDTIEIANVKSGENEEEITTQNISWEIRNSSNELVTDTQIAKIIVEEAQFGEQGINMSFTSTVAGTYTITPKAGTVTGNPITVIIDENSIVTKIELGDITETPSFRVGQSREISISFSHEYQNGNETLIDVKTKRITIEADGLKITLKNDSGIIDVETKPNESVNGLVIKATTVGEKTIKIIVDKGTENEKVITKNINILPEAKADIKFGSTTEIPLYTKKPTDNEMVKEEDGYVYTIIPLWIEDEDGNITKIKQEDLINKTIQIVDSLYDFEDEFAMSLITTQLYNKVGSNFEKVTRITEEADYVGISLILGDGIQDILRNQTVTIVYKNETKKLPIVISKKAIENINVIEKTTTGYRYDTIEIANIKSGENEEEITTQNISWEIMNSNNQVVNDTNIANITVEEAQFGEQGINMSFTATVAGTYTITPKAGTVTGNPITVIIDENSIVTKIELEEIEGNFRVGNVKEIQITFIHEYQVGNESNIEVAAKRIKVEATGLEVKLQDDLGIIDVVSKPNSPVKTLSVKALTTGEKTITITIDKGTENEKVISKTITILPEAQIELDIGTETTITLYKTAPIDNTMVKEDNGNVYTLVPISLKDEDGKVTAIRQEDLAKGTIQIVDSFYNPDDFIPMAMITTQLYKKEGDNFTKVTQSTGEGDYVGISLIEGDGIDTLLNGQQILFTYNGVTKSLTVHCE